MRCLEGAVRADAGGRETRAGRDKGWGWTCSARLSERGGKEEGKRRWGFHLGEKKKWKDEQEEVSPGCLSSCDQGHIPSIGVCIR